MAREADKFRIGLFVIFSLIVSIILIVWLGASKFLKSFDEYVTYYDESVSGLNIGSTVSVRGVPVGTVSTINIAPDGKLIEVRMEIESGIIIPDNYFALLERQGFTGQRTININTAPGFSALDCPELTFEAPLPYIRSYPSGMVQLDVALNRVYQLIMDIDTKGLSEGIVSILHRADSTLNESRINEILANIEKKSIQSMENLDRALANIENVDLKSTNEKTTALIDKYGYIADSLRIVAPQLSSALRDFQFMVQTLQMDVNTSLQAMTESMRSVKTLIDYIETNPSALVRGRAVRNPEKNK